MEAIAETSCQYCGISYLVHSKMKSSEKKLAEQSLEMDRLGEIERKYELLLLGQNPIHKNSENEIEKSQPKSNSAVDSNPLINELMKRIQLTIDERSELLLKPKIDFQANLSKNNIILEYPSRISEITHRMSLKLSCILNTVRCKEESSREYKLFQIQTLTNSFYRFLLLNKRTEAPTNDSNIQVSSNMSDINIQVSEIVDKIVVVSKSTQMEKSRDKIIIFKLTRLSAIKDIFLKRYLQVPQFCTKLVQEAQGPKTFIASTSDIQAFYVNILRKLLSFALKLNTILIFDSKLKSKINQSQPISQISFSCLDAQEQCLNVISNFKSNQPIQNKIITTSDPLQKLEIQRLAQLIKLQCEERNYLLENAQKDLNNTVSGSASNISQPSYQNLPVLPSDDDRTSLWQKMMLRKTIRRNNTK